MVRQLSPSDSSQVQDTCRSASVANCLQSLNGLHTRSGTYGAQVRQACSHKALQQPRTLVLGERRAACLRQGEVPGRKARLRCMQQRLLQQTLLILFLQQAYERCRAAWSALGALPGREARAQYVQLVQRLLPDWRAAEQTRVGGGPAGAVFSAPVHAVEDDRAGDECALVRSPATALSSSRRLCVY